MLCVRERARGRRRLSSRTSRPTRAIGLVRGNRSALWGSVTIPEHDRIPQRETQESSP